MKLNKETQYGLLFVLYLCRAGRATIVDASVNLKLSKPFLDQVARRLRIAGVLKSIRGPGGGYELIGEPLVGDVIKSLNPVWMLSSAEKSSLRTGEPEHRALLNFVTNLDNSTRVVMRRKVRSIGLETVANEMSIMDRAQMIGEGN